MISFSKRKIFLILFSLFLLIGGFIFSSSAFARSCSGSCTYISGETCQCDSYCITAQDCCSDVCQYCSHSFCSSCAKRCSYLSYASGASCQCDSYCVTACDCCSDACSACSRCPKSNGQSCSNNCECSSGYCADGVCCNSSCTGTCRTCYLSESYKGTCYCYYSGDDPANECYGTGTCGGTCNGSCGCQYPSTSVTCSSLQDCDYLNYYYQTGTESPTATEYCYYRDYDDRYRYCDGAGSCAALNCNVYSDSLQYSCGTCKYISSSNCTGGTQGSCTNYSKGTSCGTNKECDGSGNCVTCYYPTGSTSASKTTVNTGETFTITVAGHDDDHDVWQLTYNKDSNVWNATNEQTCLLQQYDCTKSWSITESTAGTYTYYGRVRDSDDVHGCSSWHEAGAGSATVTVTPAAVPPTARTDPATNVEETSATLNGCVTATGGADYRVRFVWGDTSSYGSASGWTVYYSSPTCFIYDLTGLTKGKTYHFRIEAENSAGTGYGSDAVFTTKPDPPSSFTATASGAGQINLSWTKGSGAYYTIIRRRTDTYPTSPTDGTQAYYDTGSSFSDTGLTAGTTYYYRAWSRGYEEGYYSDYSDSYASASATAVGLPTARTDPATNITGTSATLNGCVTATGGADYRIRFVWGDTSSYGSASSWTSYYSSPTCFIVDITGLTKGKTYHFRIEAENAAGTGYGSDAVFTTKPDAPTSFTAATVSASQINLSWSKGSGAYYTMVRRRTDTYPTSPTDGVQAYYDTGSSFSDTGLTGGTTYYYSAWSRAYEEGYYQYSDSYATAYAKTWSGACSALSYPTTKWQRVWYEYDSTSGTLTNCIGDGPDESGEEFDTNWGTDFVGGYKQNKIGFTSSRSIYFKSGGYYEFCAGSDDGINIWLDKNGDGVFGAGEQIFNRWGDRSYTEECSFNIKIEGAGYHKMRIDYYENTDNARVSFDLPSKECIGECGSQFGPTWGSGCLDTIQTGCNTACAQAGYCPGGTISGGTGNVYGCGQSAHWGPYGTDVKCCCCNYAFELSTSPSSGTVAPSGDSVKTTVTFSRPCDKLGECDFSASGLPSGATAVFNPTNCKADWPDIPSCSSEMTISTASPVAEGTYTITITNTHYAQEDKTKPTTFTLTVAKCHIGGVDYENGQCNPANKCQYCDVDQSTSAWSSVPSGYTCSAGSNIPVSATNYCNYDENCDDGDCYATKWYTSCNGTGSCRAASDHTDSYTNTFNASNGYVIKSDCSEAAPSTILYCGTATDCIAGNCIGHKYYRACNGTGGCRIDNLYAYDQTIYASAGKVLTSTCTDQDATADVKCAATVNKCTDGSCSGEKRYPECQAGGVCDSSATSYYTSETVYASTGYTLTSTCGTTGTTLCGYSTWNGCNGSCQKKRDQLRCDAAHNCAYDVGDDFSYLSTDGKVCSAGSEVAPSSSINCDKTIDCLDNACSAARYYRGCTAGGTSCTETGKVSYTAWNAPSNYTISETTYKVGDTCATNQDICGYSTYNKCGGVGSPYSCQKGRDQLRCNGSGVCTQDVGDEWLNVAAGYVCAGGSEIALSCTYYCGPAGNYCTEDRYKGEFRQACGGTGSCNGSTIGCNGIQDCGATSNTCSSKCQKDYIYTCSAGTCGTYHSYTNASQGYYCSGGSLINTGSCAVSAYNARSADKCDKKRDLYRCDGEGGADANCIFDVGDEWAYVSAYKIANSSGQEVDASSADNTGTCHSCTEGSCSGTLKWSECDGSGNPGPCATYNQPETVYAQTGYTLTSTCSTNGTSYCATNLCRDGGGWHHRCSKRCDAAHNCEYWIDASCVDHCTNGIKDCDETGTDCGGSCPSCDTTPPTTTIKVKRKSTGEDLTAAGSWLRADTYTIQFEDKDQADGSGSNCENCSCEYSIYSCDVGGTNCNTVVISLTSRTPNSSFDILAGKTAPTYNLEGVGRYRIYSGAKDMANYSAFEYRYINFDFTPPWTEIK